MNECQRNILTELLRRTYELVECESPMNGWERHRYKLEVEFGPEFSIVRWFPEAGPDAVRMRYARALRDLEAAGLVQPWRKWGTKISHLKLTADGERIASELLAEQFNESPTT